jgi:hypothetical protein
MNARSLSLASSTSLLPSQVRILAALGFVWFLLFGSFLGVSAFSGDLEPAGTKFANLGYPELHLVVDDLGFEAPETIASGRYLVVLENLGTPFGPAAVSDVNFLQLPDGTSIDELNAALAGESGEVPAWFGEITSAGGFLAAAGETEYALIDFEAGEWYVGVGDANPYRSLTVTPAAVSGPGYSQPAELDIAFNEHVLALPQIVESGRQVWHVANESDEMHEIVLVRTPRLLTVDEVIDVMSVPAGEEAPDGVLDPTLLQFPAAGVKPISGGRELWVELNLEPGDYVAICLIPDAASGAPHALSGSIAPFTVE